MAGSWPEGRSPGLLLRWERCLEHGEQSEKLQRVGAGGVAVLLWVCLLGEGVPEDPQEELGGRCGVVQSAGPRAPQQPGASTGAGMLEGGSASFLEGRPCGGSVHLL